MDRDRKAKLDPDLSRTSDELASHIMYLRRLRVSLQSTSIIIAKATTGYQESRALLERIDGAPYSGLVEEIHIPD